MKKLSIKTLFGTGLFVLTILMASFASTEFNGEVEVSAISREEKGFILKEYEGVIAIFKIGEDVPSELTNIETKYLPSIDRMELKNGIYMENNEELAMMLEDFGS